ncbi:MAG: alpha/beta hydrolase [Firmicutes bacterium]|nr:alpha/beta hydrolase [Bacillota bacterium]
MCLTVNGLQLSYERFEGNGPDTTVLLHGWGASTDTMRGIYNCLVAAGKSVVMPDLPYFGSSDPPPGHFGIFEYAGAVRDFLGQLGLTRINLLGHSFGGRIAIILAAQESCQLSVISCRLKEDGFVSRVPSPEKGTGIKAQGAGIGDMRNPLPMPCALCLDTLYPTTESRPPSPDLRIQKLILTDAAGVKPRRGLKYRIKVFWYKLKKRFGHAPKSAGSADYKALPEFMKPVFVRVVNTHLDRHLPKIQCPTLLVWGRNDRDTPLYMAKKMRRKIPGSGLVVLEDAGHYSFLDSPEEFYAILNAFIDSEK